MSGRRTIKCALCSDSSVSCAATAPAPAMQCNAYWPDRVTDAFWISEMRLKTETKWTNGIALIDYRLRCWSVDSVYEINNSSTRITGNKYNLAWTKQNLFATKKNSVWVSASLERSEEKEAGHLLPQTNDGNFIYPMAVGSFPGRSIIYQLFTSWPTPTYVCYLAVRSEKNFSQHANLFTTYRTSLLPFNWPQRKF